MLNEKVPKELHEAVLVASPDRLTFPEDASQLPVRVKVVSAERYGEVAGLVMVGAIGAIVSLIHVLLVPGDVFPERSV